MTTINSVIELQIILALLMVCGMVLTKKGVLTAAGRKCLTDLLIDLILPCNIINSFLIDLSADVLKASLEVLLIALGIQILCWLGGKVLFSFAEPGKKKVLQYATICSNAGFMGNPIIEGRYGQEGLLYASVYLIPLRFFMWSAGLSCFTKAKGKDVLRKLAWHPCIWAVWIGFFFMLTGITIPSPILRTLRYLSGCMLPVSILIIGSILAGVNIRTIFTKLTLYYSGLRLLAIPLVTLLICRMLGTPELVTGVSVLLAGMPAGSTTAILAEKYDGDAVYASGCIFVSTLLSLVTIPALSVLMQVI